MMYMIKEIQTQKRRTYSISSQSAITLARSSVDLTEEVGKTVTRQEILDALVECLKEKTVYTKILKIVKNND